jgi:hypothetical protein
LTPKSLALIALHKEKHAESIIRSYILWIGEKSTSVGRRKGWTALAVPYPVAGVDHALLGSGSNAGSAHCEMERKVAKAIAMRGLWRSWVRDRSANPVSAIDSIGISASSLNRNVGFYE